MSNTTILKAKRRETRNSGEVSRLRKEGNVPGVLYGKKIEPTNLQVKKGELDVLLNHAVGENLLVNLEIEGAGKSLALIQEVQHHPVTGQPLHIDLLAVSSDEMITAEVAVEPVGEAVGVKNFGGVLEQNIRQIEVECLPKDLPEVIHVDVSELGVGESVHIREIMLPAGVKATQDPELAVFHITPPRVDSGVASSESAPSAPEVIKEKKKEEA